MAVIKCSNCENEILDSEIVCPYCDYPVSATREKLGITDAKNNSEKQTDSANEVKIASVEDFEKEKAALLEKLAAEEENIGTPVKDEDEVSDKTVKISKEEIHAGYEKDNSERAKDVKEKAANIKIDVPSSDGKKSTGSKSGRKKGRKEKSKSLILVLTAIGVIAIIYLIFALFSNIQNNMSSLKGKENKKSKVFTSDSAPENLGYEFSSASTLVITKNDVMEDFDTSGTAPWASRADSIKHITIGDSVDKIGDYSFSHFTALEDVILGKNVSEIGKEAFYGCDSLKSVTSRKSSKLRTIGDNAFTNCTELVDFDLGDSLISIGDGAFKSCNSLEELEIPQNVKIGDDAFLGCSPDFTIICEKNSSAHKYADNNGINVELIGEEDEDESTVNDAPTDESVGEQSNTKTDSPKNTGSENTSTGNTGSQTQTDRQTPGKSSGQSPQTNTRTQADIMNEIKEKNSQLKNPSISADEKAKLEAERDKLSVELDNITQ